MKHPPFWAAVRRCLPFVLIAALMGTLLLHPQKGAEAQKKAVVRVWNVDTFEGGRGSRTSFLKGAALRVTQREQGIYYLVTSYTKEGAVKALAEGDVPDLISFGAGLCEVLEHARPLPYDFAGGSVGGKTYAVPWYRGGYALFCLEEDASVEGETVISCGASLSVVAAALAGISGTEEPSLDAYVKFLRGDYRYLLGTQRDLARLQSRGISMHMQPLPAFSDLYGYVSVLSDRNEDACLLLIRELLSEDTQSKLGGIGMFPVQRAEDGFALPRQTVNVFLSASAAIQLAQCARAGDIKSLQKYLRTI